MSAYGWILAGFAIVLASTASAASAESATVTVTVTDEPSASVSYSEDVPSNGGFGTFWLDSTGPHCAGGGAVQGALYRYSCF